MGVAPDPDADGDHMADEMEGTGAPIMVPGPEAAAVRFYRGRAGVSAP